MSDHATSNGGTEARAGDGTGAEAQTEDAIEAVVEHKCWNDDHVGEGCRFAIVWLLRGSVVIQQR